MHSPQKWSGSTAKRNAPSTCDGTPRWPVSSSCACSKFALTNGFLRLKRARAGDSGAMHELISDCRVRLHAGAWRLWVQPDERDQTGYWLSELDAMSENPAPSREMIEDIGGMCGIACTIPDYQDLVITGRPV